MTNDETRVLTKEEEAEARQEAATPWDFFNTINREYGFTIDVCASADNAKCGIHIDKHKDGLNTHWNGLALDRGVEPRFFCNPGFANPKPWALKCFREAQTPGSVAAMIGLPSLSSWWWAYCTAHGVRIELLRPRIDFIPAPGIAFSKNDRDSALIVFRPINDFWPGATIVQRQWAASPRDARDGVPWLHEAMRIEPPTPPQLRCNHGMKTNILTTRVDPCIMNALEV